MKKELFKENRKKLIFAAAALLLLLLLYLGAEGAVQARTALNDRLVGEALSRITYTEDAAESELSSLQPYTEYELLSTAQSGQLYRAMAELAYMAGDDMEYNLYIGYALSYLQRAGDVDSVVYLSNKYIGRLYANGCYASAEKILLEMTEVYDISSLSLEIQADYYLSCSDVAQMQGKDAAHSLSNARAAIQLMPECGSKLLDNAKYDLLSARSDIRNGDFEKAAERMAGYSEGDNFGLGEKQVYVICDFQIPYYEITAKLALHEASLDLACQNIDRYLGLCDYFQFRAMKLKLLQYVVTNTPENATGSMYRYRELERAVTAQNLSELSDEYGLFLVRDVIDTQEKLEEAERGRASHIRNMIWAGALLYAAIALYCAVTIFMDYMNKDALTHLKSRKQYERIRRICEKRRIPHCFLMIDIDDFKRINDTYGHDRGDEVLRRISAILRQYVGRGISAYRYGGEELCLFFLRVPEQRARQIAEELRDKIEQTAFLEERRITVSGGIGVSQNGEDVLQQADRQLYEAKKNGKNHIR